MTDKRKTCNYAIYIIYIYTYFVFFQLLLVIFSDCRYTVFYIDMSDSIMSLCLLVYKI